MVYVINRSRNDGAQLHQIDDLISTETAPRATVRPVRELGRITSPRVRRLLSVRDC